MPPRLARPKVKQATLFRWAHVLLPLAVLGLVVCVRYFLWLGADMTILHTFDAYVRARPRPYEQAPVRVVDIDEDSLAKLGQWPWPRKTLARLTDRLGRAGAAAIAFDMVFPEPDRLGPENDAAFAAAIGRNPVILGVALRTVPGKRLPMVKAAVGDRGEVDAHAVRYAGAVPNLPALEKAAAGVGSMTTGFDRDGVIRRVPMLETLGDLKVPVLWAEALRVAQGAHDYKVKGSMVAAARHITAAEQQRLIEQGGLKGLLKTADRTFRDRSTDLGIEKIKVGRLIVPTDARGRVWLYPTLPAVQRTIPAWKVLDKSFDPQSVEGCIVFVGTSAEGLKDLRATALDAAGAGVDVHANLAEQALLGDFLLRPYWGDYAELAAILFFGILITLLLSRFGAFWCLPVAAVAAVACAFYARWMFTGKSLLVDRFFPIAAVVTVYFVSSLVSYLKSERERRQVKAQFSRYLAPAMVEQLAKHPEKLKLGGESREMTFHFCDIRGFTTISERFAHDPHGLTQLINRFLTPMTGIILKHQGTIDKYMGDCIMAFWNAPLDDAEHARHACQAALAMHAALAELNAQWKAEAEAAGEKPVEIHIGTGLNSGPCVVGNMGSDQFFGYSVLGDDVNLASRLEGQSKTYGVNVVIGPKTRELAPEFAALELDLIKVKGKTVPVRIFALLGDAALAGDPAFKAHAELHDRMIAAYRAKRFDEARRLLERCRETELPLAKLYDLYEQRLEQFAAAAPPADWDGTFTATSK